MREKHELRKGVICEKCLNYVTKEQIYTRISFLQPILNDSTGNAKTVSRMNLCNNCYIELTKLIESFTGRPFIENKSIALQKEELQRLKNQMTNIQTNQQNEIKFKK